MLNILPNFTFIFNIFSIVIFKKITSKIITAYLLWFSYLTLFKYPHIFEYKIYVSWGKLFPQEKIHSLLI